MAAGDQIEPDEVQAPEQVSCEVCRKLLPAAEALRQESEDYVFWFCGKDCHATWRQGKEQEDKA